MPSGRGAAVRRNSVGLSGRYQFSSGSIPDLMYKQYSSWEKIAEISKKIDRAKADANYYPSNLTYKGKIT